LKTHYIKRSIKFINCEADDDDDNAEANLFYFFSIGIGPLVFADSGISSKSS